MPNAPTVPVDNGITLKSGALNIVVIGTIVLLAMIKIFVSNLIYSESKIVNTIQSEISVLKAEQVMLQQSVEALKFKNKVADTIFAIEENVEETQEAL